MFATTSPEMIGENLKRLIKESEYGTQERFAQAASVSVRTVRRWVVRIEKISVLVKAAKLLNLDVRALLF